MAPQSTGSSASQPAAPTSKPNETELHEYTASELSESGYIAFQGGVYDLADFAVGHPGGSELITEWTGKDGTDALLDAHPGGKAFIKHTLGPKDFTTALKGIQQSSTFTHTQTHTLPLSYTCRVRGVCVSMVCAVGDAV